MVQDTAGFGKKTLFIFLAFRAGEAGLAGSHTAAGSVGAPRGKGELRDCPQGAMGAPTTLLGQSAKPTGQFLERDVGVSEVGKGLARLPTCRHRGHWLEVSGCLPRVQGGSRPATLSHPSPVGVLMLTGLAWAPPSLRAGSGQDSPEGQKGYGGVCRGVGRRTGPLVQL